MNVTEYIFYLQSVEEYSFSWKELTSKSSKTETSLKRELSRLVQKNRILNLRKEFYLIIPARYSRLGVIPIQLYIHKFLESLEKKYYLGLYSAAKFHGAGHQQTQADYVMINYPRIADVRKESIEINFTTTTNWPQGNIEQKKSDAGVFNVSTPALTALNLLQHQNKLGGTNRVLAVIEELLEEITVYDVQQLVQWYSHRSTLQRFGFLLEEIGAEREIVAVISEYLGGSKFYPVLLVPNSREKAGKVNNRWKVDVNAILDSDLW